MEFFGIALNTGDPAVQSALISAAQNVLTTVVASIGAALLSRKLLSRRRLEERLHIAHNDIKFLLAVERMHCEIHQAAKGASLKLTVRERARGAGHQWSGKFTPSRVAPRPLREVELSISSR